ncbi:MAG TPA: OB-fold nucleic acid binding domain-containing protein, partial [Candidatus Deferrimicrobium sp.]|nr:OB-fold nucleic acid binding domain-containing protein [Candidatus Deferrimicrobium sp.]
MAPPSTSAPLTAVSTSTGVLHLPGIAQAMAQRLERLGITTARDLLFHLPRRYEDTRQLTEVADLRPGEVQTSRVVVRSVTRRRSPVQKKVLVEASLVDDTGVVSAVWFNQGFLVNQLRTGTELLVSGKVKSARTGMEFVNPRFERAGAGQRHVGRLAPVYAETEGVTSARLRSFIEPLLPLADSLPDRLPPEIRADQNLVRIGTAIHQVHFPDDEDSRGRAHERIAFEELFLLQLAAERARRRRLSGVGVTIPYDAEVARAFASSLPFR